ncbi:MAG TPA: DMT family transporter [Flavobacteriaceae bacterium]|jgi:drug/metabolite transporter (DMT)-like permease|nr:DMT family transporter [Flavobacteriaceae bacterium]HEX5742330.1 DMT family transporter [Flavobacteriaceae bacterium]
MEKNSFPRHIIELNIALLLISTSGVLGRYINLAPPVTIWLRCILAAVVIGLYCWKMRISLKFDIRKNGMSFLFGGLFLGIHWITYFYSLQLSNVAIAMLSLFTFPVITALLEPLFFKMKLDSWQIFLGIIVLVGIYFLMPNFDISNDYTKGVLIGVVSAFFYALRNIVLKKQLVIYQPTMLMFHQLLFLSFMLWPVLFMFETTNITIQWQAILTLAIVTTAMGHTLFVVSLKNFSASTAGIFSSIQPVYGIILAYFLLDELPSANILIGGFLILTTVGLESFKTYRKDY